MHVLSWQIWCVHEPPTSMHIPTLKPWLKVKILTMWFATVSLFSHCGLLALCMFPLQLLLCVLSWYVISLYIAWYMYYLLYCWQLNTEPHDIRFAVSTENTAPWLSGCSDSSPPRACPLSHHLSPGQTRSCKGVILALCCLHCAITSPYGY